MSTKELVELGTVEPARDPVQGVGGLEYLNYAAHAFSDEKFAEYYTDRAEHLIGLHHDTPGAGVAIKRLETLL